MVEEKVKSIIDSLSNSASDNFTDTICLSLAKAIKADYVFIAKLNSEHTVATTISLTIDGVINDNFSYDLQATPCQDISEGNVCCHTSHAQQAYPDDQLLIDMNIVGYVGVPLKNSKKETDAILVALYRLPIESEVEVVSLFMLFSGMIIKEIEKQELIDELRTRNKIIEESSDAIIVCDKNYKITSVNKAFSRITGYSFREVEGKNPNVLGAGLNDKYFFKQMWEDIIQNGAWSGEIWNKKKNGEIFPEYLSINVIFDEHNNVAHYVAFFIDITKQKQAEEKIYRQAHFDLLTGIANRSFFMDKLSLAVHTLNDNEKSALLFMDLDLFKEINDVHGHNFGDELLIKASCRLQALIKSTDIVARVSGDGFAILLNNVVSNEIIDNIIARVFAGFREPFVIHDTSIRCTLSMGVISFSDDSDDASTLIKKAEHAMCHAKDNGRNSFSYFTQNMQNKVHRQLFLKKALSAALTSNSLSVVFQPIVAIKEQKINKFEALVRWKNEGQWISPEEFIPIAEEFSLIKPLGEFVLDEACRQLKILKSQGYNDIVFNVNRSVYEIPLNKSENDQWLMVIKQHGLKPSDICFELTESALAPDKRNNEGLFNQLRIAGCTIALDDFGTGYSSLSYLRRIPVDYIKIDQSFIREMSTNKDDNILVSTIIAMSKSLGKKVVAEGVETKEQLQQLTELGCDLIQGYYFSKPLASESLVSYLTDFKY
ncbi:MAG: GGDEF domain-containing protein [Gammaproteobacteria bacterium]|nr:MAG: GGDEF domain-containing protein [Gammaproteobacteria bacterium]PHR83731.1 MAG: GGDEF domain-containing protein [Colwellia sp.]